MKNGFTVIELLIVVAIFGILTAIALPMCSSKAPRDACPTCGRAY